LTEIAADGSHVPQRAGANRLTGRRKDWPALEDEGVRRKIVDSRRGADAKRSVRAQVDSAETVDVTQIDQRAGRGQAFLEPDEEIGPAAKGERCRLGEEAGGIPQSVGVMVRERLHDRPVILVA
jgi:hypothetical protein